MKFTLRRLRCYQVRERELRSIKNTKTVKLSIAQNIAFLYNLSHVSPRYTFRCSSNRFISFPQREFQTGSMPDGGYTRKWSGSDVTNCMGRVYLYVSERERSLKYRYVTHTRVSVQMRTSCTCLEIVHRKKRGWQGEKNRVRRVPVLGSPLPPVLLLAQHTYLRQLGRCQDCWFPAAIVVPLFYLFYPNT